MRLKSMILLWSAIFSITATAAEYRSKFFNKPVKVLWSISGKDRNQTTVKYSEKKISADAAEYLMTVKNNSNKPLMLTPAAEVEVPFAKPEFWNGYVRAGEATFDPGDKLLSTWFPAQAAFKDGKALIMGVNPMSLYSRIDSGSISRNNRNFLRIAFPVYLEAGKKFTCSVVLTATYARYKYHDVIQKYYDLFPNAYKPAIFVSDGIISSETGYLFWNQNKFEYKYPSEVIRRVFAGRSSWEWCYKPFILAGDWGITDATLGWGKYKKAGQLEKAREKIRRRMSGAAYCNVQPMWYLNVRWTGWDMLKRYPGINTKNPPPKRKCWGQDATDGIYSFGGEYGKLFLKGLDTVAKDHPLAKGIGWDSCFAHQEIQPDNAGYPDTFPKSFYDGKPMALEAVGVSHLLDHSRRRSLANAVNFKLTSPYMIGVRTDAGLYEGHPMQRPERLMRLEAMRARLGSPKTISWHKHFSPDHIKWVDWEDMTNDEAADALSQLAENTLFLSYYWGCIPAPTMPAIGIQKLMKAYPELIDLCRLGWQPSPAIDLPRGFLAARYGKMENARIAVINPGFENKELTVKFPASYWNNKAVIAAPENGKTSRSVLKSSGTELTFNSPARSITVIKVAAVAELPPKNIEIAGTRIAEYGNIPFYRFEVKSAFDMSFQVKFGRSASSDTARIRCAGKSIRFKTGEPVELKLDTATFERDVQAGNLRCALLEYTEYPRCATYELDPETLSGIALSAKAVSGEIEIVVPSDTDAKLKAEVQRIADWFSFHTEYTSGKAVTPQIVSAPSGKKSAILFSTSADDLGKYQQMRAFSENGNIKLVSSSPEFWKELILETLNRFDATYPWYGKLPVKGGFEKAGLAGKTLMERPVKRRLRPTLLEMMERCKIY